MRCKSLISIIAALILVAPVIASLAQVYASPSTTTFYIEIEYILKSRTQVSIILAPNEVREIIAPPEPEGYKLEYMIVTTSQKYIPKYLAIMNYDKEILEGDKLSAVISLSGKIKIVNSASKNFTTTIVVEAIYAKRTWIPITPETKEISFNVTKPEDPLFTLKNLTIRVTIDNYAPYRVSDVIGPEGTSLIALESANKISASAFSVDLKHVVLDFSSRDLREGTYTIKLLYFENAELPSAFIVRNEKFIKDSVPPQSQKSFTERQQTTARHLGYVIVLYSVIPKPSYTKAEVKVISDLVDLVFNRAQEIVTYGASYLVPPLRFKFWVKAFVVFGEKFTVVNGLKEPLNVLYMPITIKPTGKWTPKEVIAEVSSEAIEGAEYAYLVVQLPPNARIRDAVSPSGITFSKYVSSQIAWGSTNRSVSVSSRELYIQVKSKNIMEVGSYRIYVDWLPINLKVVDYKGNPIPGAKVTIKSGAMILKGETSESGQVKLTPYVPGTYELTVYFKGKLVNKTIIPAFYEKTFTVKCSVYDLKVTVVGARGQSLSGAIVLLVDSSTNTELYSLVTDDTGTCVFKQIPAGEYTLIARYKRVSSSIKITVDKPLEKKIQLDVFIDTPLLNLTLTTKETIGVALALITLAGLIKIASSRLVKKKSKDNEIEESIEEEKEQ
ncbi:MAG: hypothetical protein DRN04_01145 [Thermoprotei archaeon]|nr:MAG: hypothetical protein DRN04_01145 [Thermoprotei archaeon]